MTQTAEVMENQAQEFIDYCVGKGFTINQNFIDVIVDELKSVGMWRESVSIKTFKMGLAAAIDSGKITAPATKTVDIAAAAAALAAKFPPIVKHVERQLSQKEKSALAGISSQSGRVNHSRDDKENESSYAKSFAEMRSQMAEKKLRREYLELKGRAEAVRENTHARTYAAREKALRDLNAMEKYASVRD